MITHFLPTFHAIEVGTLSGLRMGWELAQFPANANIATVTKNGYKYIENGIIVGLNADGTIGNYDSTVHTQKFVHFTEELNTILNELKYYALPVERKNVVEGGQVVETDSFEDTYPRCVAFNVGDSIVTDNYDNTAGITGNGYAVATNGILTLQASATGAEFIAKKTTMPAGTVGYEFTLIK